MCQSGPSKALDFLPDRGAAIYALNQLRGPTFIMNGTMDQVVVSVHTDETFFAALRDRTSNLERETRGSLRGILVSWCWTPPQLRYSSGSPVALSAAPFPYWSDAKIASFDEVHIE